MLHVANSRDFRVALSKVIRHASQPTPSRHALAEELEDLAAKLGARAPRKKKPSPKTPSSGRQVLVNIAEKESRALEYLMRRLMNGVRDLESEVSAIRDGIERLEEDAKADEREVDKDDLDAKWKPNVYFSGMLLDQFREGVDHLADVLETNVSITREEDLAQAVRAFLRQIPKDDDWPEGKGEQHFKDVQQAMTKAIDKLPTALAKASDLGKLRDSFDAMVDALKLITGKTVAVPKIPRALDPEDPRQLGFGFTASSRRIENPTDLNNRLQVIQRMASQAYPSREMLGGSLLDIAHDLRARR